ncbi:hypothetical protein FO519_000011 [Halicephalobus sp. NKZ332]|nr:hypothetical protein FO519_000011 [Halicephalobus sp. NKZ332]
MEEDGFKLNWSRKNKSKKAGKLKNLNDDSGRADVSESQVGEVVNWAIQFSDDYKSQILEALSKSNKSGKIVQIQIYGVGSIDSKTASGPLQLAVAIAIQDALRTVFPMISMTIQEPIFVPGEVAYLKSNGINVVEGTDFSNALFEEATRNSNLPREESLLLCYMIHGEWSMLDQFLEAHWTLDELARTVIVGNSIDSLDVHPHSETIPKRIKDFAKICQQFPLRTEKEGLGKNAFVLTSVIWVDKKDLELKLTELELR